MGIMASVIPARHSVTAGQFTSASLHCATVEKPVLVRKQAASGTSGKMRQLGLLNNSISPETPSEFSVGVLSLKSREFNVPQALWRKFLCYFEYSKQCREGGYDKGNRKLKLQTCNKAWAKSSHVFG